MSIEFKEIQKLFGELQGRKPHLFPEKGKPRLENDAKDRELDRQGVYIIRSRRKIVLHVGRTLCRSDGLRGRFNAHLGSGQSSFTNDRFDGDGSRLRKYGYTYQFLVVENDEKRAILEAYATGKLCPRHIGIGRRR